MSGRTAFLLALPGLVLLLALMILPALSVLPLALTDWEFGRGAIRFTGMSNFAELLNDPRFGAAFWNTVRFVIAVVPATLLIGFVIAGAIEDAGPLKPFYRAAHFLPVVATMSAMALAWETLLHPTIGVFNQMLGLVGVAPRGWLQDESLVLPTLIGIGIWQNIGFAVVMFLAGFRTIPQDLLDAAQIDGAVRPLDRMRTVTLPLLSPIALFITVITAKRALGVYDTVAVLTKGGPAEASEVMLHLLYVESFERLRAGYGAAITVVYLLLLLSVTVLQRVLDKRVHYR
ncbi:MAG: sugar ABC transporter permease [Sphingopyxis sp.]|nr:sugar ABC transporter permease [Sphingopyxis sp.]